MIATLSKNGPPVYGSSHIVLIRISSNPALSQPHTSFKGAPKPLFKNPQLIEAAIQFLQKSALNLPYLNPKPPEGALGPRPPLKGTPILQKQPLSRLSKLSEAGAEALSL